MSPGAQRSRPGSGRSDAGDPPVVSSGQSGGARGIIGVFFSEDPGGVNEHAKKGEYLFPLGEFWDKGIGIEMGQAPVKQYNVFLRDMIVNGRAKPSFIVSRRLPLSKAPEAYAHFERGVGKGRDYTKVVLKPAMDRAA